MDETHKTALVDDLLAGINLVGAAEAVSFGLAAGLSGDVLYDAVQSSVANSNMWETYGPGLVDPRADLVSTVQQELDRLGTVLARAERPHVMFSAHLASAAHQALLAALTKADSPDASVAQIVRLWSTPKTQPPLATPSPHRPKPSSRRMSSFKLSKDQRSAFNKVAAEEQIALGEGDESEAETDDDVAPGSQADVTPVAEPSASDRTGDDYFSSASEGATSTAEPTTPGSALKLSRAKVAFVGLGGFGLPLATRLLFEGFNVVAQDDDPVAVEQFRRRGGRAVESVAEAVEDAGVWIVMGAGRDETEAWVDDEDLIASLAPSATLVICSTLTPSAIRRLSARLATHASALSLACNLIDAPVVTTPSLASRGILTISASQDPAASRTTNALPILRCLAPEGSLRLVPGGTGSATALTLVIRLLESIHLVGVAEAVAFSVRLGLSPKKCLEWVREATSSRGASVALIGRGRQMWTGEQEVRRSLGSTIDDLRSALEEARQVRVPTWIGATAMQQLLLAASAGWQEEDDSCVVGVWGRLSGESVVTAERQHASSTSGWKGKEVAGETPTCEPASVKEKVPARPRSRKDVDAALPAPWEGDACGMIKSELGREGCPILVVIASSVDALRGLHGVDVLLVWEVDELAAQFSDDRRAGFYVLADFASLAAEDARQLIKPIAANIATAATRTKRRFDIALCVGAGQALIEDESIRKAFEAVDEGAGRCAARVVVAYDPWAGIVTVDDVCSRQSPTDDGEMLLPIRPTGVDDESQSLVDWITLRSSSTSSDRNFPPPNVVSVSVRALRAGSPLRINNVMTGIPRGTVVVVNGLAGQDLDVFIAGLLASQNKSRRRYLFEATQAFVARRMAIDPISLVHPSPGDVLDVLPFETSWAEVLKDQRTLRLVGELLPGAPVLVGGASDKRLVLVPRRLEEDVRRKLEGRAS